MSDIAVLTADNFEDEVAKSDTPIVLFFWAKGYGRYDVEDPFDFNDVIEAFQEKDIVRFLSVNVDDSTELAEYYGVESIPEYVILEYGKEYDRLRGAHSVSQIVKFINRCLTKDV